MATGTDEMSELTGDRSSTRPAAAVAAVVPLDADQTASNPDPDSFLPTLSAGTRHRLLKGDLDNLPAVQSRVLRVYISSHFSGTPRFLFVSPPLRFLLFSFFLFYTFSCRFRAID